MKQANKLRFALTSLVIGIVFAVLIMSANMVVYADIASPEPISFTQPNGKVIQVTNKGDEFLGWSEDDAGNLIIFDKEKNGFCFADWEDEGAVSTGELVDASTIVMMIAPRTKGTEIPQRTRERAEKNREESTALIEPAGIDLQELADTLDFDSYSPPVPAPVSNLERTVLIIHVTWEDRTGFETKQKLTGEQIYDFVFNPATKSVNDYYKELIGATQEIIKPASVNTPMDGKQGIIEVTLAGSHTDPKNETNARRDLMVRAVSEAVNQGLIDFSRFDKNGNERIETTELAIGLLVDGFNSSSYSAGPGFWGVSTSATPAASVTNGKKLTGYFGMGTYNNDNSSSPSYLMGIGTICHELGHSAYGFDDTYDYGTLTGSYRANGMGYWTLMDVGSHAYRTGERSGLTPPYVDAYNLVRYGFVTPGTLGDGEPITVSSHNEIYIAKSEISDNQYFLIQQRKYGSTPNYDQGGFDRLSPVESKSSSIGGVLIYHVDESVSIGRINDKPSHMYVSIEEAHGGIQNLKQTVSNTNLGDIYDLWGIEEHRFDNRSDPASNFYSTFTNDLVPPTQNILSGTYLTDITWNSTEGTSSYIISTGNYTDIVDKTVYIKANDPNEQSGSIAAEDFFRSSNMPIDAKIKDVNGVDFTWVQGDNGVCKVYTSNGRLFYFSGTSNVQNISPNSTDTFEITITSANYPDIIAEVTFEAVEAGAILSGNITGCSNIELANTQQVMVTLIGDTFSGWLPSENWITNLPKGLSQSVVLTDENTATITVSGTPTVASNEKIEVMIPAGTLVANSGIGLAALSSVSAVYEIIAEAYILKSDGGMPYSGFEEMDYGYVSGSSVVYTLTNTGNQIVTDIAATITVGSSTFEVESLSQTTLEPGDTATVTVTSMTGLDAGTHTGVLTVTWANDGGTGITENLSQTVNKVAYTGTKTMSDTIAALRTNTARTLILPELPNGASYAAAGTLGGTSELIASHSVSGTALTYSTISRDENTEATITIAVTGAVNYNDYDVVVTITTIELNTKTLTPKIKEALAALNSVIISADGSELWKGAADKYWVTQSEYDEFYDVLINAYDVISDAATQSEIDLAAVSFDNAIPVFLAAKKVGTGMLDYSVLTDKIKEASTAKTNVLISENGSELSESTEYHWWVTQGVMDKFDEAIMTAVDKLIIRSQSVIDEAVIDLTNATKEFLAARQRGIGRFLTNYEIIQKIFIADVQPNTKREVFAGNFYPEYEEDELTVNVYNSNGELLEDGDTVGTSMTVEIIIEDKIAGEFKAVIYGDITSDGNLSIDDAQDYLESLVGNTELTPAQILALDGIVTDGDSAIKNLRALLNFVMNTEK